MDTNVPSCGLCGEPGAGVIGVLPEDSRPSDSYIQVCPQCVDKASKINQWKEHGEGI